MKKLLCVVLSMLMLATVCGCKDKKDVQTGSFDDDGAYNAGAFDQGTGNSENTSDDGANIDDTASGTNDSNKNNSTTSSGSSSVHIDINDIGGGSGNSGSSGAKVDYKGGKVTVIGLAGTIDKLDSSVLAYKSGETINFTLKAKSAKNTVEGLQIKYTATYEDGTPTQTGIVDCNKDGKVQIKLTPKGPGFIRITATACVGGQEVSDVATFNGGVGVDVDKITTKDAAPADFESYWKGKVSALPEPKLVSKTLITKGDGYEVYNVKIAGPDDTAAYAKLNDGAKYNFASFVMAVPTGGGSYPVEVKYLGHGVDNITSHTGSASKIMITVSAHSIDAYNASSTYWNTYKNCLDSYQNKDFGGQSYFVNMILRDYQVIRWLVQNDLVTAAKSNGSISLMGGSQGGFQAVAVAGLCGMNGTSISKVYKASIVWNCNLSGYSNINIGSWHTPYNQYTKYIDTVYFAPYVKCKVTIDPVGLGDDIAPPSANMALYNALSSATINFVQNYAHGSGGESQTPYKLSK